MNTLKTAKDYLWLPYDIRSDEDFDKFTIFTVSEIPDIIAWGCNYDDAMESLLFVMESWFENAIKEGREIPLPRYEDEDEV